MMQHMDRGREGPTHVERWRRSEPPTELQYLQEAIVGCDPGAGPLGAHLFVYRFPDWADEKDLRYTFSQFGTVTASSVSRDRKNPSKTHALVSFSHSWEALAALQQLHGHPLQPAPEEERDDGDERKEGGRWGGGQRLPARQRKDAWEQILVRLKKRNEDPLRKVMQLSADDPIPDLPIVPLPWKRMGAAFDQPPQDDALEILEKKARESLTEIVEKAGVSVEEVVTHMRSLHEKRAQQALERSASGNAQRPTLDPAAINRANAAADSPSSTAPNEKFSQSFSGAPLFCFIDKTSGHGAGPRQRSFGFSNSRERGPPPSSHHQEYPRGGGGPYPPAAAQLDFYSTGVSAAEMMRSGRRPSEWGQPPEDRDSMRHRNAPSSHYPEWDRPSMPQRERGMQMQMQSPPKHMPFGQDRDNRRPYEGKERMYTPFPLPLPSHYRQGYQTMNRRNDDADPYEILNSFPNRRGGPQWGEREASYNRHDHSYVVDSRNPPMRRERDNQFQPTTAHGALAYPSHHSHSFASDLPPPYSPPRPSAYAQSSRGSMHPQHLQEGPPEGFGVPPPDYVPYPSTDFLSEMAGPPPYAPTAAAGRGGGARRGVGGESVF